MQAALGVKRAQFDRYRQRWSGSKQFERAPESVGDSTYFWAAGWFAGFARYLIDSGSRKQAIDSALREDGDDGSIDYWAKEVAKERALKMQDERLVREGKMLAPEDLDGVVSRVSGGLHRLGERLCEACKPAYGDELDRLDKEFASLDGSGDQA